MRHRFFLFLVMCVGILSFLLSSCSDDSVEVRDINTQTVLIFMPWSGSADNEGSLYPYLKNNLDSIESAIKRDKRINGRVLVFFASSPNEASLYEIKYSSGNIQHDTIKTYNGNSYDTTEGMAEVFSDVQKNAYALNYALIVGGHGTGWTYKSDWSSSSSSAKQYSPAVGAHHVPDNMLPTFTTTRFFGSASDMNYAFDIPDLAAALRQSGMKTQYILFDDCYMANIEVAYELRDVTNYLIASTSEVMALGMPYYSLWNYLNSSTPQYESIVNGFHSFYSSYTVPCGALSAIDCRKVDQLAAVMKEINRNYTFDESQRDSVQVLDGYNTPIFYDMGSYVDHLCKNANLRSAFHSALDDVVKYKATTPTLYTALYYGSGHSFEVKSFSGITISDPSLNSVAVKGRMKTAWWEQTH
jgi:hypothetical protein